MLSQLCWDSCPYSSLAVVVGELATALMEKLHPHSGEMAPPATTCELTLMA